MWSDCDPRRLCPRADAWAANAPPDLRDLRSDGPERDASLGKAGARTVRDCAYWPGPSDWEAGDWGHKRCDLRQCGTSARCLRGVRVGHSRTEAYCANLEEGSF